MSKYENDSYYEHKFVCINRKDVLKSLNGGELHQFDELLRKIHNGRYKDVQSGCNTG